MFLKQLKVVLPEQLATLKKSFDDLHGEDSRVRAIDYDVFYRIGIILSREEQLSMSELSEALAVPLSTASRMADWMVNAGYLERVQIPEDRRVVLVRLTSSGQKLYRTVDHFLRERVGRLLEPFTAEERRQFAKLLGKLQAVLEAGVP